MSSALFVPDAASFASFVAVSLAVNVAPGPDMMFVAGQSMGAGASTGRLAALGIAAGSLCHALLAAAGISTILAMSPRALTALTYVGAAYLAWLGITTLRRADAFGLVTPAPAGAVFRRGMVTNLLNPKVVIFYFTFIPQFVDAGAGPQWQQVLLYGVAFNLLGTLVLLGVAEAGAWASRQLSGERPRRVLPKLPGVVFLGLAVRLLWP